MTLDLSGTFYKTRLTKHFESEIDNDAHIELNAFKHCLGEMYSVPQAIQTQLEN